ncbi:L-aspartate oxidase [Desulfosporosinus acidiphilus SJ4]|uniref:L-aspartate oxidase n=1 Tax=Desulfosporosinus acidiphilus (strain DSM 22704 / JCM 16185 / SJ4) TaxID=646529 RepID=I4D4Y7_DESAJ|nr:L-aspartate oxidase [Desulfosporosinus acidiphilus]AFM40861.1 L-aspartate oxidase [Desulfosporosinus acidiphilus SJ4]
MKTIKTDLLIIGSGIAGLSTAVGASPYGEVIVISKDQPDLCNSTLAQGGIAAAVGKNDSPEAHTQDTLTAGVGICEEKIVEILTEEAPKVIDRLIELGTSFDRTNSGELALGREGAHRLARVIHRGDDTGAAIWEALFRKAQEQKVHFLAETRAEVLLVGEGHCHGALVRNSKGVQRILARNVVLATGGIGEIYGRTTNSPLSTGDGLALAWKAGAVLSDLEFVQFHPTALDTEEKPLFLISEAVRGEGAVLVTEEGERFMLNYHPQSDLAPRDVVTRAIVSEQKKGHQVYLDTSALGDHFEQRFPNIYAKVQSLSLDPRKDLIPVTPAAHFLMGGIRTDSYGRTNIIGLYACGECANTGVHGANRLASNSLLEGLVFGQRVAQTLTESPSPKEPTSSTLDITDQGILKEVSAPQVMKPLDLNDPRVNTLQKLMWSSVGIIRNEHGMTKAYQTLCQLEENVSPNEDELRNMILVAKFITSSALKRLESRGSHYRVDYPEVDAAWKAKHLSLGGVPYESSILS